MKMQHRRNWSRRDLIVLASGVTCSTRLADLASRQGSMIETSCVTPFGQRLLWMERRADESDDAWFQRAATRAYQLAAVLMLNRAGATSATV